MRRPLATLALIAAASPALAGVTADQVWAAWQSAASTAGMPLTGLARRQGNHFIISRVALQVDSDTFVQLDRLTLEERADGSVAVLLPDRFPVVIDLPPPAFPDDPEELSFSVSSSGLDLSVYGLGQTSDYRVAARTLTITLDPVALKPRQPGGPLPDASVSLAAADIDGAYGQDIASADKRLQTRLSLGTLHAGLTLDLPDEVAAEASFDISDFAAHLSAALPASAAAMSSGPQGDSGPDDVGKVLTALQDGLLLDAGLSYGPAALHADVQEAQKPPVLVDLQSARGQTVLKFDKTALIYDATQGRTTLDLKLTDPEVPFTEGGFALDEYRAALKIGVNGLLGPQDWGLAYRIAGLTLSDSIWAAGDPQAILPRSPITLSVDLSGRYAIDPAALSPGYQPAPGIAQPLTQLSTALNSLLVQGLGLQITGQGALDYDLADLATFDGAPVPQGKLSFLTSGANGLINNLAKLGLLQDDEVTAARFGLLFIGRAGQTPDTLTTEIEFRDKTFYLNGQKIR